ncbi:hypothetical protein GT003_01825 [Paenibacillus sacheonensis]|uniref:Uncharacterized protein n=1 Tax=Paenibacillus sacheonensis TaxID=742054 RepID=A0A7X5BWP0_9BACL|nr:hypothetical protein [Paenibacillus sacheonensis]
MLDAEFIHSRIISWIDFLHEGEAKAESMYKLLIPRRTGNWKHLLKNAVDMRRENEYDKLIKVNE